MKKSMCLALIVGILISAGVGAGMAQIVAQEDKVQYRHTLIAGELSEAEGISFHIKTHWTDRLFWDTKVELTADNIEKMTQDTDAVVPSRTVFSKAWTAEPEYDFWSDRYVYRGMEPDVLSLGYSSWGTVSYVGNQGTTLESLLGDWDDYIELMTDVVERTPDGESRTEQIRLADYETYYPVHLDIETFGGTGKEIYIEQAWEQDMEAFTKQYFGFRVPQEHIVNVKVVKTDEGTISDFSMNDAAGATGLYCFDVEAENGVYFTFNLENRDTGAAVESESGSGIFYIPVEEIIRGERPMPMDYQEGLWEINVRKTKKVFALSENCKVLAFQEDEESGNFFLVTKEEGDLVFRMLRPEDGEAGLQEWKKYVLMPWREDVSVRLVDSAGENIWVVFDNGDFCYLIGAKSDAAENVAESAADNAAAGIVGSLGEMDVVTLKEYAWDYRLRYRETDRSLAIICQENGGYLSSSATHLYVFDESGLQYHGKFESDSGCRSEGERYPGSNSVILKRDGYELEY